uniref:S-4 n=1 Tax=Triticum kiharae TaxID=376535 RepID=R4ZC71_TRIKH|nr:S-4 [Triticum kiharae]
MGVKCGVVVWCLLLAGLLLLAVASAAERDTEKEKEEEIRLCKKVCDWKAGEDTGKARECKEQCERRRHGHEPQDEDGGIPDRCKRECESHEDMDSKLRCTLECWRQQKREGDDRCERMCQHYHDRREKKPCMKGCRYGESDLLSSDDGHEHGDRCQTQCKRLRPGSYDRQQCIERCQCQQKEDEEVMNHHGGGGHGHGGSSCEQKCQQRYRHEYDKQQCVRDCKSGGGGGAGGRGREGDERQHGREMVIEAILEEV